jgi:hypothetical protein
MASFSTDSSDEPSDDHHEALERESAGSRAIDTESETEESVNDSSGVIVGGPSKYLQNIPKVLISVQNKVELDLGNSFMSEST